MDVYVLYHHTVDGQYILNVNSAQGREGLLISGASQMF